jgi:hypothetical protein
MHKLLWHFPRFTTKVRRDNPNKLQVLSFLIQFLSLIIAVAVAVSCSLRSLKSIQNLTAKRSAVSILTQVHARIGESNRPSL